MNTPHRALPELWAAAERFGRNTMDIANCLLELRDRVTALEAQQAPQPAPDHIREATEKVSAEQQARDMLEGMGIEDAQDFRASDLTGLANLIADAAWLRRRVKELESAQARCPHIVSSDEGTSYCALAEQGVNDAAARIERFRNTLREIIMICGGLSSSGVSDEYLQTAPDAVMACLAKSQRTPNDCQIGSTKPTPPPAPASGLVKRVADVLDDYSTGGWEPEARKVIREIAAAARNVGLAEAAAWLEHELING